MSVIAECLRVENTGLQLEWPGGRVSMRSSAAAILKEVQVRGLLQGQQYATQPLLLHISHGSINSSGAPLSKLEICRSATGAQSVCSQAGSAQQWPHA